MKLKTLLASLLAVMVVSSQAGAVTIKGKDVAQFLTYCASILDMSSCA